MSDEAYTLTIAGLLRKRAAVVGDIARHQATLADLLAAQDHLDATIRLLDPAIAFDDRERRPPPIYAGFRGELSRFILDTLRQSGGELLTFDLARAILTARGQNAADRKAVVEMGRKVGHACKKMRDKRLVESRPSKPGAQMLWWIAPSGETTEQPGGWRNADA